MQADPLAVRCVDFRPARVEQVDAHPGVLHGFVGVGKCGRSFECAFAALDGLNHGINRAGTRFGVFHSCVPGRFGLNFRRCLKPTKTTNGMWVFKQRLLERPIGFRYMTDGTHMPDAYLTRHARF